ncbi:hypothetical protein ACOSQ3_005202 [Xanthoceras sorbifolium]
MLHKLELSSRLVKWVLEQSVHDINYQPCTTIKSQVLADFIADFTLDILPKTEKKTLTMSDDSSKGEWTLAIDDSNNVKGNGLGTVLTSPEGHVFELSIRCGFKTTNNEAEYEALVAGLKKTRYVITPKLVKTKRSRRT